MTRAVRLGLLLCLIGFAMPVAAAEVRSQAVSPSELADHPLVMEIRVEGLETVSTSTVLRAMETQAGKPFDWEAFRRDQSSLARLGYFDPLEFASRYERVPGGIVLILQLREMPQIRNIVFVGNVRFNEKQLRAEFPQQEGELLRSDAESWIRRAIRGFYREAGYHDVRITVRQIPVETGEVDITVYIDEGERIKIKDMILHGNDSYPTLWIVPRLVNHGSWLFFSNYYDDELFQTDLETVRAFYMDRGFLDVQVRAGTPIPGEGNVISPVIEIEEGRRYTVREVELRGHTLFVHDEVHAPFRRLIGKSYDGDSLRAAIEKLRDLYGNEGYIDLEVNTRTVTDPDTASVRLELSLVEGDVVYVGIPKVNMRRYEAGEDLNWFERFVLWVSPPTKDETILREVRLEPGQKYRRFQEVRTVERLQNLRILEKVDVRREATDDPQVRNPVIEAEESANAGHVTASVGYGDITGAAFTVGYLNPNIAGEAKVLSATATFGQRTQRYQARYLNRHWRDSDDSLELSAYLYQDRLDGYRQRIIGSYGEVGRPLTEYLTAYLRLRVEHVKFRRRHPDRKEPLDPYYVGAVRGMLEWDHRDSITWPTRGFRVAGGLETGYADGALLKFLHSFGYYKRVWGDVVWAYEHDFGVAPYSYNQVGITERFFMGGTSDLRGFRFRGASPTDSGYRRLRVGGSTKFVQRNEIRFPIVGALKGRIFLDDGINERNPLNFRRPRVSSGLGVILDLKAVNVEIDFARALVYEKTDARRLLHFRISSGF